jgi:four helix bundle protein
MSPPSPITGIFRFQKLEVWQDARRLNLDIYRLAQRFPATEQFGLTSQVRRASVSIAANIAEGSGRNSDKDFAHFLELSYGSAMELASHFVLAGDLGYIETSPLESSLEQINRLSIRIAGLNRSLNVKTSKVIL